MELPNLNAPYLHPSVIEKQAEFLLAGYESSYGKVYDPPVPIEKIAEQYLGLTLQVLPLEEEKGPGWKNVLGFVDVVERHLVVNSNLDPMENPDAVEGRFYFTIGHECGHDVLHKQLLEDYQAQQSLFDDNGQPVPALMCRAPEDTPQRPYIEKQADAFAAAILMPKHLLMQEWQKHFGTDSPLSWEEIASSIDPSFKEGEDPMPLAIRALRPMAEAFKVSQQALRIRLETVNLIADGRQGRLF